MDFSVADVNKLSAPDFRRLLDEIEFNPIEGQPYFFFNNHDQVRTWDRYGDGVHNDQIAKLMAALLLTTRATPQMYYGEELGMRTTVPTRKEDVKDPVGRTGWPKDKGRDGERTPMQWDRAQNAGFSTAAKTWLPVPPSAAQYNVVNEANDPDSILNFYKHVISLRRDLPALRDGGYVAVNRGDPNVLSYLRKDSNIQAEGFRSTGYLGARTSSCTTSEFGSIAGRNKTSPIRSANCHREIRFGNCGRPRPRKGPAPEVSLPCFFLKAHGADDSCAFFHKHELIHPNIFRRVHLPARPPNF
jgi:glycosidase